MVLCELLYEIVADFRDGSRSSRTVWLVSGAEPGFRLRKQMDYVDQKKIEIKQIKLTVIL